MVFTKAEGNLAYIVKARTTLMRDQGAALSPFNAFLLLQGLETLSLRVERHVENALKVVDFLKNHPKVEKVNHPSLARGGESSSMSYFPNGAASIFTFEIKGGGTRRAVRRILEIFSLLANCGGVNPL